MKFNMDIKTLIFIISVACAMGGFYYTTEARLDSVEKEASYLGGQVRALQTQNKWILKQIRNIKKGQNKSK